MTKPVISNLYSEIPDALPNELFELLHTGNSFKLERIVSRGHITPPEQWYDQNDDEWVILLQGAAKLIFRGESHEISLKPGDYLFIPAHSQHRVCWTDPDSNTVWLALHCQPGAQ